MEFNFKQKEEEGVKALARRIVLDYQALKQEEDPDYSVERVYVEDVLVSRYDVDMTIAVDAGDYKKWYIQKRMD